MPYKTLKVIDSRLGKEENVVDILPIGPADNTFQTFPSTDPASLAPVFTVITPGIQAGINRTMRIRMRGTLTIVGTGLGVLTTAGSCIALRQFPLQACMGSLNCTLNAQQVSLGSVNQYVQGLAAVANTSGAMATIGSTYPSSPDQFADYAMDLANTSGLFSVLGAGPYSDQTVSGRTSCITSMTLTGTTQLVVGFDVSEPLILSPWMYSENTQKSVFGVTVMSVQATYTAVHRMLSMALTTAVVTGVTLLPSYQALECSFVTPHPDSLREVPRSYLYDYTAVQQYNTTLGGAYASGAAINIASGSIQLPIVPSKIVIFATYATSDVSANVGTSYADVCFALQNITVQFAQKGGLLSAASPVSLWEIARRGGSRAKFPVWAGKAAITSLAGAAAQVYAGSPLIIDVAADLSLPTGIVPGMSQQLQLQVTANYINQTLATVNNPRLCILALTPGYIEIKGGTTNIVTGGVMADAVERARDAMAIQSSDLDHIRLTSGISGGAAVGGGLWDWIKDTASDVWDHVKENPIQTALEVAAIPFGAGGRRGGASVGGASAGGARSKILGGALLGGAAMSRGMY